MTVAAARADLLAGNAAAAEAGFRAALAAADAALALEGLGLLAFRRDAVGEALPLLQAAEALGTEALGAEAGEARPRLAYNVAIALARLGREAEAIARHRANVADHPGYVPSWFALGELLGAAAAAAVMRDLAERALAAGQAELAGRAIERLTAVAPEHPALPLLLGRLRVAGLQDLTARLLQARMSALPGDLGTALGLAMARLAVVHATKEEIAVRRAAYTRDLQDLAARVDRAAPGLLARGADQVGPAKPFFLAYQGEDDTTLQALYGDTVSRMMRAAYPMPALVRRRGDRRRIGFATGYFHLHSVTKLFGGWIRHLDRTRFELFGYSLDTGADALSAELAAACDAFHAGSLSHADWCARIAGDGLDALVHLELGMHPAALRLACHRLAPLQAVAFGHPVTSGLPDIDMFLSAALFEPADGDRHYRERLVRLPNLGIHYDPLPAEGGRLTRADLGLRDDAVVYVCCQSLFKYHPRDDAVLPAIAARVPAAQFLFIADPAAPPAGVLRHRLGQAFAAAGLAGDRHLVLTPPVAQALFPSLLRAGDVFLDSIGWSGGNTTLEAIGCDLPIVTMPSRFLRGRLSAGILERMGLGHRVAATTAELVDHAARLAEPAEAAVARAEIVARRPILFADLAPVRALEAILAAD